MLGTSARIGEALALRRCDVDVTSDPPTLRIAGTVVYRRGEGTVRQDHPKTARSRRTVALPSFTAEAVRQRLTVMTARDPEALLFASRNGTPLTTHNVRRQLRHVMQLAGIEGVTPHAFRRTAATAVHERVGTQLAAELLGHTDERITVQHYIRRDERVNAVTAKALDDAFGTGGDSEPRTAQER
ncbi:site-specific integrase [Gryllotalpicola sp.]|uniref:site-specific integrase n=1 Tax=Gryllotalpicola sp. TaxID=1932787 RepID=UPI002630BF1C|nr:site-specific integrase [Gryllotalpicola sp.]